MNSDTYNDDLKAGKAEDGAESEGGEHAAAKGDGVDQLQELQTKLQDSEKKYLYLYSEFENFRRRTERDRLDFIKFGHEGFLRELLQVLDNFERALQHAKEISGEKGSPAAQITQGIEMIHYQLAESLKNQGVVETKALGAKFDPAFHEAVGEEAADAEPGTILKVVQKGYQLHGRLLRAARVIVAKA